ncbi:MAG: 4-(cytidine 5'-diphospho)-2-C-methyl-D-erythritol kinase [Lachnospiraceae bacterium]|nr:4-(cytidine 5'-diphospho)-2-C-methyl-D-erythritol kinase [Lachnospiraceae bacterium]
MNRISIKSYAKINLGLDVTGVLPNGYHTVKMIMQTISLCDNLYFEKRKQPDIILKTNLPYLPVNEKNIVYKAIKLFKENYPFPDGLYCNITKHIPVAAGMAGGSGNAAAALIAMDRLFSTRLSMDELMKLGVKLGADVPFCLLGGTALAEGIGELLTPLPSPPKAKILIVKPSISVSTADVYNALNLGPDSVHPDINACISAIKDNSLYKLCSRLGNILEDVTFKQHPEISEIKEQMLSLGAAGALMSGSGPTVFGLFSDEEKAESAHKYFSSLPEYQKNTHLCDFT